MAARTVTGFLILNLPAPDCPVVKLLLKYCTIKAEPAEKKQKDYAPDEPTPNLGDQFPEPHDSAVVRHIRKFEMVETRSSDAHGHNCVRMPDWMVEEIR